MGIANEIEFENDICAHLAAHGWLYSPNDTGYDRERALFPEDVHAWIQETQPQAWAGFQRANSVDPEAALLNMLAKTLASDADTPQSGAKATGGTLFVLRKGFKASGAGSAGFSFAQFRPASGFNPEIVERYSRNRLRVMRQVHYSTSNRNSIDLVLFVNGIPVATIEVKTDFTQAVEDAKRQYQKDRLPKDAVSRKAEPLLSYKRGALVHFAVSTEEVWMTTRLAGDSTFFLPFNQGNAGGAGNPPNPAGYPTAYFWEEILGRDMWLRILGAFIQVEFKTERGAKGKTSKETLIFPRYHQLKAVNKLIAAAQVEGAGHHYLFQHSAGSGKSNTIGWCAHQLSTLHTDTNEKVFDTVIVITDRTVLDAQLKDTIGQFQSTPGVVVEIDSKYGSKSSQLSEALKGGALIVVVTLQTFPFILAEIRQSEGLARKRFAVIIDEAHSSQSGDSARQLRAALAATGTRSASAITSPPPGKYGSTGTPTMPMPPGSTGYPIPSSVPMGGVTGSASGAQAWAVAEDIGSDSDTEITAEDLLLEEAKNRRLPKNASFLAFTATPKPKTLEVFGRLPDPTLPSSKTNLPEPFDEYSMRQAIEEKFILDVLKNYTPYRVAYKLAHNGKDWDEKEVDKSEGMKALHRWVRLHPHNISQKVQVIVEHFRTNVAHLLGGKAKAMVVTDSRQQAVRYKLAMDQYIAHNGYKDLATIVAFSGDVTDEESGPDKFNESNMNPGLRGRAIPEAFRGDDFQVLIVANKYQTGFDQPLLVAMYVDKRIDGITAVQTLSRLNRMYPGKDTTYVIDFVNKDVETIRLAFEPYYGRTELLATTDPNLIYTLQTSIDVEQIYTDDEAVNVAGVYLGYQTGSGSKRGQKDLIAALSAPVDRFKQRWIAAEQSADKEEMDRLTTFQKNLGTFCRLYDFLSQIVSYEDAALEARYILFKHLEPLIRVDRLRQEIDLTGLQLAFHKIKSGEAVTIVLGGGTVEERSLKPITGAGSHTPRDPVQARLDELVEKLNTLFDDGTLTDADRVGLYNHVAAKMRENHEITQQARANTKEQFAQSPTVTTVLEDAVIAAMDSYQAMVTKLLRDPAAMRDFRAMQAEELHAQVNQPAAE